MTQAGFAKTVQLERRQGVLTLSLNRPNRLNAINNEMARELVAALEEAAGDGSVRSIVIRGNGRAFCAGRDISEPPTDQDLVLCKPSRQPSSGFPSPL